MEVDPEQRPERISIRGMGGWALTKINNRPFRATNMHLAPPRHQTPLPISRENAVQTSGRGFYGKRGAHDGAICIYNLEYINWCESRAICPIPALNQLPWNSLASLNSDFNKTGPLFSRFHWWKCNFWLFQSVIKNSSHSLFITVTVSLHPSVNGWDQQNAGK